MGGALRCIFCFLNEKAKGCRLHLWCIMGHREASVFKQVIPLSKKNSNQP